MSVSIWSGQALLMPGFCFNRLTDFVCYMWIMPEPPPPPTITYHEEELPTAAGGGYDYGDYDGDGGGGYNDFWGDIPDLSATGTEFNGYDNSWDYDSGKF